MVAACARAEQDHGDRGGLVPRPEFHPLDKFARDGGGLARAGHGLSLAAAAPAIAAAGGAQAARHCRCWQGPRGTTLAQRRPGLSTACHTRSGGQEALRRKLPDGLPPALGDRRAKGPTGHNARPSHPKIALLVGVTLLLPLSVPGQGNTPTCPDGYNMQTGANGVRYCLVSGVPSISSRRPDDASSFTPTAGDGHSALCSPSNQETVSDPRLFSGYQYTFTRQFSWDDLTWHGSSWSLSGTTERAL